MPLFGHKKVRLSTKYRIFGLLTSSPLRRRTPSVKQQPRLIQISVKVLPRVLLVPLDWIKHLWRVLVDTDKIMANPVTAKGLLVQEPTPVRLGPWVTFSSPILNRQT